MLKPADLPEDSTALSLTRGLSVSVSNLNDCFLNLVVMLHRLLPKMPIKSLQAHANTSKMTILRQILCTLTEKASDYEDKDV